MKQLKKNKKGGYTLIELIISIGVIMILSALIFITVNVVNDSLKVKKINDEILYLGTIITEISENPAIMSSEELSSKGYLYTTDVMPFLPKEYNDIYMETGLPTLMNSSIGFQINYTYPENDNFNAYNAIQLNLTQSDLSETQCVKLLNKLVSNKPAMITVAMGGSPELTIKNIPETCADNKANAMAVSYGFTPATPGG